MNDATLIRSVQNHFNDYTDGFKQRIENEIPLAIEAFASEHQWEFLDKYITTTAATESSTSKDYIDLSAITDFFKPVEIWVANNRVTYIDREKWADYQRSQLSALTPYCYTVIGDKLYLGYTSDGSTIYMIYTRVANNVALSEIPDQYHPAIEACVIYRLTPAYVSSGDGMRPNPLWSAIYSKYLSHLANALSQEAWNKNRERVLEVPRHQRTRNNYR